MKYTVNDLRVDFPDEDACLRWLVNYLYPYGIFCVECDRATKHYRIRGRKVFSCGKCGHHVSPLVNTPMEKSRTPLTSWFYAIYLMSTNKAGTSAKQIERELGVTYKTAWRMMHQIRKLMSAPEGLLTGEVELDETFVHANTFKRSSARKRYGYDARRTGQVVFGMVQRDGQAKVWHVDGASATTIMPLIRQNIQHGTVIHTDGWIPYRRLPKLGYNHRWTDHGKLQFYTEASSTQNIENMWSHFKRGIKGVYRHIDKQYIQAYANEYCWRYNHRKSISMFWSLLDEVDRPLSSRS